MTNEAEENIILFSLSAKKILVSFRRRVLFSSSTFREKTHFFFLLPHFHLNELYRKKTTSKTDNLISEKRKRGEIEKTSYEFWFLLYKHTRIHARSRLNFAASIEMKKEKLQRKKRFRND